MSESGGTQLVPRIVIAAPQGRSGKTVISLGLCAALRARGLMVQPFKRGPDYIDPSWLTAAAGRACRNLDAVLMPEQVILSSFSRACRGVDLAIIEGAMGLYDGLDEEGRGSTAQVARLLDSPIILVVNAARMTRSIAAMVSGYQHFEPETNIAGVILNNISGSRHEHKLAKAIEQYCGIPVVGSIPRHPDLSIAERHLGLMPFPESEEAQPLVERIQRRVEPCLNLEAITTIGRSAPSIGVTGLSEQNKKPSVVRLGVMLDRAFHFYYPDNLEALVRAGAELVFINSLRDSSLPDVDGLYIGGGFPEFFLPELEANQPLRRQIAQAIEDYLPVYAECAGLMYLCQANRWQGKSYEMVGAIPAEVEMEERPQGHGYVRVEVAQENSLFPVGFAFWGHEFHHSRLSLSEGCRFAYRIRRGHGIDGHVDGVLYKNVFASYTHLHALGVPQWAEALVSLALQFRKVPPVPVCPTDDTRN